MCFLGERGWVLASLCPQPLALPATSSLGPADKGLSSSRKVLVLIAAVVDFPCLG